MLASQESLSFFERTDELEAIQTEHLLENILKNNQACAYGRRYDFANISSLQQYQANVPLITFEDIREYAERMAAGESNLLTSERVLAFFKTSGSLASPKLIPVTPSFVREKARAFGVYWQEVYKMHPGLKNGRMIANFTDSGEVERCEGGQEVLSEATFWGRRTHGLHSKSRWPIPKELRLVKTSKHRYYAAARLVLQGELHGMMVLNPSTLLMFCREMEAWIKPLIDGLEKGDWGRNDQAFLDDMPAGIETYLAADPERASILRERLAGSEQLDLSYLWPELEQFICWRSQIVQPYFRQLQPYLSNVAGRDYITQSSECIMAIPIEDQASGGVLAYQSHFYEFIPESQVDSDKPQPLFAWQLEQGQVYELVVTTGGGLYRYRMGDCMRVKGFYQGVPIIEFLYRAGKTSSMTGEKLTEYQVMEAAQRAVQQYGQGPREMVCFPRSGDNPHYGILINWDNEQASSAAIEKNVADWLSIFDQQLGAINTEYGDKCASGRLGSAIAILIGAAGFDAYRQLRKAAKVSESQQKNDVLTARLDIDQQLTRLSEIHAA